MLRAFWSQEPAIVTVLGSVVFWKALFSVCSAFGHPLTQAQEEAVSGLAVMLAGAIIRTQVSPTPSTSQKKD